MDIIENIIADEEARLRDKDASLGGGENIFPYFQVMHASGAKRTRDQQVYLDGCPQKRRNRIPELMLKLPQRAFVCANEKVLKVFVSSLKSRQISKSDAFLRRDFDEGKRQFYHLSGFVLAGSDTIFHLRIDGEEKIVQVLRDKDAPIHALYWQNPGGLVAEKPSRTGLKEFGEEISILVDDGAIYHLLHGSLDGEKGIAAAQKSAQIENIRKLASKKYPETFDSKKEIRLFEIELTNRLYSEWKQAAILTKHQGEIIDRFDAYVTIAPARSALAIHRPLALPESLYSHAPFDNLRHGKNCFFVDNEYGREVEPFSFAEIAAISDAGKYSDNVTTFFEVSRALENVQSCKPRTYPFVEPV